MEIELEKLDAFSVCGHKNVEVNINDKKLCYRIPYAVNARKANGNIKRMLSIGDGFDKEIELTEDEVNAVLQGDESVVEDACFNFVYDMFLKNRFCYHG